MRGMDTVVFTATVLALAMVDTALALAMAMERGPLMLMPTTVTEAFMALAMEGMAMVDSTDMERGPLMLTPSHGWDMVDSTEVGPMVSLPSWPTPTAQCPPLTPPLRWQPPPTTLPPRARGPLTPTTDTEDMDSDLDTDMVDTATWDRKVEGIAMHL